MPGMQQKPLLMVVLFYVVAIYHMKYAADKHSGLQVS